MRTDISILRYKNTYPQIAGTAFLASGVRISGDIVIGEHSGLWFNVAARGDVNFIRIGSETNIQDNSVIHVTHGGNGTTIGDRVTVGHGAILHACTLEDECLIGMGAIILDGAVIPKHCLVGAGALVAPDKTFEPGTLIVGSPARVKRALTDKEIEDIRWSAAHYVALAREYGPL